MKFDSALPDEAILGEMGRRLARVRLGKNLTQAQLAERAGVSKRTIERLESGEVAPQLTGFVRICRALGLVERLERVIPDDAPGPRENLGPQGRKRRRASGRATTKAAGARGGSGGAQRTVEGETGDASPVSPARASVVVVAHELD